MVGSTFYIFSYNFSFTMLTVGLLKAHFYCLSHIPLFVAIYRTFSRDIQKRSMEIISLPFFLVHYIQR